MAGKQYRHVNLPQSEGKQQFFMEFISIFQI